MMIRACASADVATETPFPVELAGEGLRVVVVRDEAGAVHALEDRCTHEDVALSDGEVWEGTLECWKHGSAFDLQTGKPTALPAVTPVRVFDTEERDGSIYISL